MNSLIGIFAPVGESKNVILGPELVAQPGVPTNWCTNPATDYWDVECTANWTGDDTKLVSDGNTGALARNIWSPWKRYRVELDVIRVAGTLFPPYCAGKLSSGIDCDGKYIYEYITISNELRVVSVNFLGSIGYLSVREIREIEE